MGRCASLRFAGSYAWVGARTDAMDGRDRGGRREGQSIPKARMCAEVSWLLKVSYNII
jgi:hypothetical protein